MTASDVIQLSDTRTRPAEVAVVTPTGRVPAMPPPWRSVPLSLALSPELSAVCRGPLAPSHTARRVMLSPSAGTARVTRPAPPLRRSASPPRVQHTLALHRRLPPTVNQRRWPPGMDRLSGGAAGGRPRRRTAARLSWRAPAGGRSQPTGPAHS